VQYENKVCRKTLDSDGIYWTSDIMEVDSSLISKWLLNRVPVPILKIK